MSFRNLAVLRGHQAPVRVMRIALAKDRVWFRPPFDFIEQLGWKKGDTFSIQVGEGEDLGWARMMPQEGGWHLAAGGGGVATRNGMPKNMRVVVRRVMRGEDQFPGAPATDGFWEVPLRIIEEAGVAGLLFRLPWTALPMPPGADDAAVFGGRAGPSGLPAAPPAAFAVDDGAMFARQPEPSRADPESAAAPDPDPAPEARPDPPETDPPETEPKRAPEPHPAPEPERAAAPIVRADPETWPEGMREAFVEAAARGATARELAAICGQSVGSVAYIKKRYLEAEIAGRVIETRIEAQARNGIAPEPQPHPEPVSAPQPEPEPEAQTGAAPAPREPHEPRLELSRDEMPAISETVLGYLRTTVNPMLQQIGYRLQKSGDGKAILLNGNEIGIEELIDRVNTMFELDGDERLQAPAA